MRLAGTCSRYSNSAMPQLITAATYQAFPFRLLRCPYQAKVMKMLERISRPTVLSRIGMRSSPRSPGFAVSGGRGVGQPAGHLGGDLVVGHDRRDPQRVLDRAGV